MKYQFRRKLFWMLQHVSLFYEAVFVALVCVRVRVLVLHIRVFCCTHTHRNKGVLISSHKTQIFLLQQFRDKRQKPELLLTECNNAGFFQHSGVITLLNLHSLVLDSFRTKRNPRMSATRPFFSFLFFTHTGTKEQFELN